MARTPREIARELFRDNRNASVFEITHYLKSEALKSETVVTDLEFVTATARAYWKLKSDHSGRAGVLRSN